MTSRHVAERRGTDRRVRNEYPEIERRKNADRRGAPVRQDRDKPGLITWGAIAIVGFMLIDALLWHGQYRQAFFAAIEADAASVRAWSDNVWSPAAA